MKRSIKGLFVILAIVMSFVLVQGVWARENIVLTTFEGTVTEDTSAADGRSIGLDTYDDENFDGNTDVMIYGMGPSWYWDDEGVSYPMEGESLKIVASYCEILGEYVGVIVYDSDGNVLIELRDIVTLKPLWNSKAKTTVLSDTAAEATGDGEPNDYSYYHDNDNDYNWKYEQPGPHKKDF
jgi:hypothetical protein